jgi:hypothetical protein
MAPHRSLREHGAALVGGIGLAIQLSAKRYVLIVGERLQTTTLTDFEEEEEDGG